MNTVTGEGAHANRHPFGADSSYISCFLQQPVALSIVKNLSEGYCRIPMRVITYSGLHTTLGTVRQR